MAEKINIKLKRSLAGASETQRKTIQALGLRKIGQVVSLIDSPATRGAVKKVSHMVDVVEM